ncbi:MAG: threonylcarbamoyl-AMP synthase [Clostridiaceae bacterium]|nr:threonylcarbamoyl-AMP synthase [Clostridiaceae bacterium]
MPTEIIRVDAERPDDRLLEPAAMALRRGRLVAFPTETVYGLGANALDPAAVAAIFQAKGRPGDNPLIVHVTSIEAVYALVDAMPPVALRLFAAFSPGPLTLVLSRSALVPDLVTAGLDTVAVRLPAHPVARRLIDLAGFPIAAPSANRSGRPSPTRAWHVAADLEGRISYIVDAGECSFGIESTVVDVTGKNPVVLRPGSITNQQILEVTGVLSVEKQEFADSSPATPRSPGMKYRHYAPRAKVLVAEGSDPVGRAEFAGQMAAKLHLPPFEIGYFGCRQFLNLLPAEQKVAYGDEPEPELAGRLLFDALRRLDRAGVKVIIAEGLLEHGVGIAYMNRLRKAAGAWQIKGEEDDDK